MLNLDTQAIQALPKPASPVRIKSLMNSRNTIHTPTIEYMADRKKYSKDFDCIENRIEAGTKSYIEGMEQSSLHRFLRDTKAQKNKYQWKGSQQIEFNLDNLNDSIGNELSKLIRTFTPSLMTLHITIRANNNTVFQDKDMEHLSFQIARHLPQLKEFSIMIVDCDTFTDKGVRTLVKQLAEHCFNLEKIELSFPACFFVTDESLKSLFSYFSRYLKKLKHLTIYLSECKKITETGIGYLREDLKSCSFRSLESLSLNFYWCFGIRDRNCSIELENDVSQYLPNLHSFSLKI